jgi:hypothetical protein
VDGELIGDQGFDPAKKWPQPLPPRRQPWWFLGGFLAGAALSLGVAVVRIKPNEEATLALATPVAPAIAPGSAKVAGVAELPDETQLRARWDALREAYIKAAQPLADAIDRAEKLRAELPALQAVVKDTEARFVAAKAAREGAETDYSGLLEAKARPSAEAQPVSSNVARTEMLARQSQSRLDAMKRDRQKAVDALIAKGETPATADALARTHYDMRITTEQNQLQRLQPILDRAKAEKDHDARFGQPKRLAIVQAEIEARRIEEAACQAASEKAKGDLHALESRIDNSGLSPDEKRQLDQLLEIVRGPGSRPPVDGDPLEFLEFLDRFSARLDEVRPPQAKPAAKGVTSRFNTVVNRLLRIQDTSLPSPADRD